jgi:hypothetical protein
MALSLITVTGSFSNPDGHAPSGGKVTATLISSMFNAAQTVPPQQIVGILDQTGALVGVDGVSPFQLYPTNTPGTTPINLTYAFTVVVDGFTIASFSAAVPYNAPNSTIDISALVPSAVLPVTASFIPAQIGQSSGQSPVWNGTAWVPTTFDAGGAASAEAVRAEAAEGVLSASLSGEVARAQAAEAFVSGPQVLGNTGAAKTLTVANLITVASCVLTANCALTITGFGAGAFGVVAVIQDGTGGRTLTVNGVSVPVTSTANAVSSFLFWSPDGTNLYVR